MEAPCPLHLPLPAGLTGIVQDRKGERPPCCQDPPHHVLPSGWLAGWVGCQLGQLLKYCMFFIVVWFLNFYLFYVYGALPAFISVHHIHAASHRGQEKPWLPGTGVTGGCELPRRCWQSELGPEGHRCSSLLSHLQPRRYCFDLRVGSGQERPGTENYIHHRP